MQVLRDWLLGYDSLPSLSVPTSVLELLQQSLKVDGINELFMCADADAITQILDTLHTVVCVCELFSDDSAAIVT